MSDERIDVDYNDWKAQKEHIKKVERSNLGLKIITSIVIMLFGLGGIHLYNGPWVCVRTERVAIPQAIPPIDPDVLARAIRDFKDCHIKNSGEPVWPNFMNRHLTPNEYEKKWDEKTRLEVRRTLIKENWL